MCVCVSVCVCLSVFLFVCLSFCLYVCLSFSLSLYLSFGRDWVGASSEKTPFSMAAFETTISCLKDAEKQTPQDTLQLSGCGTGCGEQ